MAGRILDAIVCLTPPTMGILVGITYGLWEGIITAGTFCGAACYYMYATAGDDEWE